MPPPPRLRALGPGQCAAADFQTMARPAGLYTPHLGFLAKRDAVDFAKRRAAVEDFPQRRLPQRNHAAGDGPIADLRQRPLGQDHFLDFIGEVEEFGDTFTAPVAGAVAVMAALALMKRHVLVLDRKSTRLNSSHVEISYAVFCLKKKNITRQ